MNHKDPFFEANQPTRASRPSSRVSLNVSIYSLTRFRLHFLIQTGAFGTLLFFALGTYSSGRLQGRVDLELIGLIASLGTGGLWSTLFIRRRVIYERLVALYPALGNKSPTILQGSFLLSPVSYFALIGFLFFKKETDRKYKHIPFVFRYPYLIGPLPMLLTVLFAAPHYWKMNFQAPTFTTTSNPVPALLRPYLVGATTHYFFKTLDEYTEFKRYERELVQKQDTPFSSLSEVATHKATTSVGAILYGSLLLKEFVKYQESHKETPEKVQIFTVTESLLKLIHHWDVLDSFLSDTPKIAFLSPTYVMEWAFVALSDLNVDQRAKDKTFQIFDEMLSQLEKTETVVPAEHEGERIPAAVSFTPERSDLQTYAEMRKSIAETRHMSGKEKSTLFRNLFEQIRKSIHLK